MSLLDEQNAERLSDAAAAVALHLERAADARDHFACVALQALLHDAATNRALLELARGGATMAEQYRLLTSTAYRIADAMMAERDKPALPLKEGA